MSYRERDMRTLPWEGRFDAALLRNLQRQRFVRCGADVMLDENTWHAASSEIATRRAVVRHGTVREFGSSIRPFMPAELCTWLHEAGFARSLGGHVALARVPVAP